MATCQTQVSADGFDVIRLCNPRISITVLPELGGKIYEILDLETGRDWLWKNPYINLRHPSPGMDYERDLDSGGWDEILFSVKPCTLAVSHNHSLSIGDHGNVVDRAWRHVEKGVNNCGEAICDLISEGQSPDFKFQRRIVLDIEQPRFSIEYSLRNSGSTSWPWMWCAHPLLNIDDGMHIHLQQGQQIRTVSNGVTGPVTDQAWPDLSMPNGESINLTKVFESPGGTDGLCQKLYVKSEKQVCLSTADGEESFNMMYDPQSLPWLGLWINNNGWSGCGSKPYRNLGIEPSTTPHDCLTEAVRNGNGDILEPGESRKWYLAVNLKNRMNMND